jgi:hypothetical protein
MNQSPTSIETGSKARPTPSTVHAAVCCLRSAVHHSFIRSSFVDGLSPTPSTVHAAVRRPQSLIRLFVPHSLTARPPDMLKSPSYPVHRPRRGLPSAVRRPRRGHHSFIRSPFVDGLPPTPSTVHAAVCCPRSAVHHSFIRSPFVDGLPPTPSTVHAAVCRPRSAVYPQTCATLERP